MAEKDTETTQAEEGSDNDTESDKGGKLPSKNALIVVLSALLLVGLSVGGTALYLGTGAKVEAKDQADVDDQVDTKPKKSAKKKQKKAKKAKKKQKKIPETVVYHPLDPAFVVNFEEDDELHFLQVSVEVMAYDNAVIEDVRKHAPAIRNGLVLLLSKQSYKVLNTLAGKEKLRADALTEVRKVLKQYTGKAGVESVFFTSFVMQ